MIGLHAAGITDVGQVRSGNEDSLHVGDSVFAVADGMGGHRAGEVASALALEPIAALDGRVFGDVDEARAALGDAVVDANRTVVDAAAHDSSLSGMGTTLTAALFEGRRLHVAHVGDSRAYLLRDGDVVQLTRDHTFVQQLLDDGRITEDEVATHPHRSVITRAIGAQKHVEVDMQTIDLRDGDAVLLCSDGLSGPVEEDRIAELLRSDLAPAAVVTALVDAANDAGGPDNITAVLLTVVTTREDAAPVAPVVPAARAPEDEPTTGHDVITGGDSPPPGGATGTVAGVTATPGADPLGEPTGAEAAEVGPDTALDDSVEDGTGQPSIGDAGDAPPPRSALLIRPDGDAGAFRPLPGPGPDESVVVDPALRRRRIASIVVAVAIVLGLLIGGGRWLLSRSFFVGVEGDRVVIYNGIPAELGPIEMSWVVEETGLGTDQLSAAQLEQLESGIAAANATDARGIVAGYREAAEATGDEGADDPTDDPTEETSSSPDDATSATP